MWSIGIKGITILNKFQKPFSKVVCIFLEGCSLGPNSIDWLFPNMELLRYKAVNVSHGKRSNSCSKSIETVCRLNPQLKYFEVHLGSGLNMQLLADLSKYLQSLASLKIYVNSKEDLYYEGDTIHFKSLNYFDINLKLKGDELFPKIPFSSDRLKSLEIRTIYRYSDELFKFISNHPTIDTLRFWSYMYIDEMNVKKIASVLPALKIIDFYDEYSFEEVCDCLTEFKLLKRFKFRLKDENKLDDLRVRFGNEWQISKTIANFIEMKRTNSNTSIFFPQIIFCCILYEP
ncbi:uncharacterized protein LOC116351717 [Contarinia nasturtii]|uniref:uncharacterized protein LOC116351717 n=1 Tax=Contarinia nasturtii TaxID=265458 RepID=UPI0012D37BFA|nr:uncharacterized protein LOC116351717 [Contarinia nasturtii]